MSHLNSPPHVLTYTYRMAPANFWLFNGIVGGLVMAGSIGLTVKEEQPPIIIVCVEPWQEYGS